MATKANKKVESKETHIESDPILETPKKFPHQKIVGKLKTERIFFYMGNRH